MLNGDPERKIIFFEGDSSFFSKYLGFSFLPVIGQKKHINRQIIIIVKGLTARLTKENYFIKSFNPMLNVT